MLVHLLAKAFECLEIDSNSPTSRLVNLGDIAGDAQSSRIPSSAPLFPILVTGTEMITIVNKLAAVEDSAATVTGTVVAFLALLL